MNLPSYFSRVNESHPMPDHDKTALAEIAEHNRVLAENQFVHRENKMLRAQVLNLMAKLVVVNNFVPRVTIDLASTFPLTLEETPAGLWARRLITHHMGS